MLAVVVSAGTARIEHIEDSYEALSSIVGGLIEPFFTEASPEGNGAITGYVNEEGLMMELPVSFGVFHSPEYITALAGDAVIVGMDEDGETRGLTDREAARVVRSFFVPKTGLCPIISGPIEEHDSFPVVSVRSMLSIPSMLKH